MTTRVILSVKIPQAAHLVPVADVVWDSAETINIEAASSAVLAHDIADLIDSLLILIHTSIVHAFVQRIRVSDLEIAQSEVDRDCDFHLPALRQVIEQTWAHIHLKLVEEEFALDLTLRVPQYKWFIFTSG